jgi:hypothetical protein
VAAPLVAGQECAATFVGGAGLVASLVGRVDRGGLAAGLLFGVGETVERGEDQFAVDVVEPGAQLDAVVVPNDEDGGLVGLLGGRGPVRVVGTGGVVGGDVGLDGKGASPLAVEADGGVADRLGHGGHGAHGPADAQQIAGGALAEAEAPAGP